MDPPIAADLINPDTEEDWFCWHCDSMDDCLSAINEVFESNVDDWRQLFPEVNNDATSILSNDETLLGNTDDDADDEEAGAQQSGPTGVAAVFDAEVAVGVVEVIGREELLEDHREAPQPKELLGEHLVEIEMAGG